MRYIIIGTSAAAIGTINKLRQLAPDSEIIVFSDEQELPYNKCFLADFVAGSKEESTLITLSPAAWQTKRLTVHLATRIVAIDPDNKTVTDHNDTVYSYDRLCIATGSSPLIPQLPGIDAQGVYKFHSQADANALVSLFTANHHPRIVIVGAGLTGLECADALQKRGAQVTVVEMREQVLAHFITPYAASLVQRAMNQQGVTCVTNQKVTAIVSNNSRVTGVQLGDGSVIQADAVIFAIGVRPNTQLAIAAGLTMSGSGIAVNEYMQTSNEHIFAAGDVITITELTTQTQILSCTWPDAMLQGIIAAHAMAQQPKPYPGAALILSTAFFGLKLSVSYGANYIKTAQEVIKEDDQRFVHLKIENNLLKSFLVVGNTSCAPTLKRMMLLKEPFDKSNVLD